MSFPINLPVWQELKDHHAIIADQHMRDLFDVDPQRFRRFSREFGELLIDFSKHRINNETFNLLIKLAHQANLPTWVEKMFSGEFINHTEHRAALHTALRNRSNKPIYVAGHNVMPDINQVLEHTKQFSEQIRNGEWQGYTGKSIRHIVNIGIGGSDLGPKLVCQALQPYADPNLIMHFVSNVDGAHITRVLSKCDPETTLFIIASKTFTTQETMTNAHTARSWITEKFGTFAAVEKHFVAISTSTDKVIQFGIDIKNIFSFWDWVGGRYSLWSAIGLPIILYIGMDHFNALLEGAYILDQHFLTTPLSDNIPVILALLGIWYQNFFDATSHVVLVYDEYLRSFPDYLQQLDMESNGKSIDRYGQSVQLRTGPILWGGLGNNGQHAFYQLLHQGTHLVPADFLAPMQTYAPIGDHHRILLANCFAQSEALMIGKTPDQVRDELRKQGLTQEIVEQLLPYKVFLGNRPSTSILYNSLTPKVLGSLIALYEHKIYTQGVLWNINSFDQWGVELGKQLSSTILGELNNNQNLPICNNSQHDSSTLGLIEFYKKSLVSRKN